MEQLKMYLLPEIHVPKFTLPEGFSVTTYRTEADQQEWFECCLDGKLVDEAGSAAAAFKKDIFDRPAIDPYHDVFFLDFDGQHIATSTCYIDAEGKGDLHMVGMRTAWRGKGLAKYIVFTAVSHLNGKPVKYIHLTTDEFRLGAIRTYLNAGFLPVNYDADMKTRWEGVLRDLKITSCVMLKDDGSFDRIIYAADADTNCS